MKVKNIGKITQIIGAVIDVRFDGGVLLFLLERGTRRL